MEQEHRIQQLAQKYLEGTATEEELKELHAWYDDVEEEEIPEEAELLRLRMQQAIDERIAYRRKWLKRYAIAASVLGLIAAAVYFGTIKPASHITASEMKETPELTPAGKATLTLGDGSVITLDTVQSGALSMQGNTKVIKLSGAELAYNTPADGSNMVYFNTIRTPRGSTYQVILPDGTKVWLNALSSLRFPTAFTGDNRKVELTGEAYFDVAQLASKPFLVAVNNMEVEVLGTEFNIMAYENESSINTSLLKGSVRVSSGASSSLLKPGQQAQLHENGALKVINNRLLEDEAAWKNGEFIFNNENLGSIMRKLSRWYDIEIIFTSDQIKNRTFTGQISRTEKLSEVLKMLELTETIHFNITDRKVTATP